MTSLPNTSHPALTPGRRHRHRRSAAISGDFDLVGLGLFSPTNNTHTHSVNSPNNISAPGETEHDYNEKDDNLDRHFHFNNDDDFCKKATEDNFSFPNRTPELSQSNQGNFTSFTSPPRRQNNYSLNSPIKLNHSKSASTSATPKTKFFLTEETNFNNENVPDAVIDLDEIFKANMHVEDTTYPSIPIHKRTQLTPPDLSGYDEFLASPFLKPASSPFISSPLSATHNPLFHQPIKEQISDNEDIDDIDEIDELDEMDVPNGDNIDLITDQDEEFFTNPQHTLEGLYSNSSANSSCSSIRSTKAIEKTFSNSSNNSGISNNKMDTLPHTKRSGAKAHRYQSFYDQSFKVSNALKVSSSESINIVRSNSITIRMANTPTNKEIRLLGHSSSLPSLKSNSVKRMSSRPSRLGETRFNDVRHNESKHIHSDNKVASRLPQQSKATTSESTDNNKDDTTKVPKSQETQLRIGKNNSNSPASINSNYTSLSISGTIPSTEHSSVTSHNEMGHKNDPNPNNPLCLTNPALTSNTINQSKSASVHNKTSTSHMSIISDTTNASNVSNNTATSGNSSSKTPAIVVSSDQESIPSTDSTFKVDNEPRVRSQPSSTITTIPAGDYSPRQISPKEEAFLKKMEIPTFKKSNHSSPKKNKHTRSKSNVLVNELEPSLSKTRTSDKMSLKQKRRTSKFISWFKRK